MKFLGIISFVLSILVFGCSSSESINNHSKGQNLRQFNLTGNWQLSEVNYIGEVSEFTTSDSVTLFQLFGTDWKRKVGKFFQFNENGTWSSTVFEQSIDQTQFTYSYDSLLMLKVDAGSLKYNFPVLIIDSSESSMVWGAGNDFQFVLQKTKM